MSQYDDNDNGGHKADYFLYYLFKQFLNEV